MFDTPGEFAVSPTGAATYTIPLKVPPGVGGMEPKLALVYNSQGGDGILGKGWSLSGLSAIARCPQTVAQDGARGGVNFDANDRFCLDGQRLIAVSGVYGVYGGDGTEYRTEIDGFSRVISHGVAGNGPAWFEVHTKAGLIMEYGNTTDSRILAANNSDVTKQTTARVWALDKITDTVGNYLVVAYIGDDPNGNYYPNVIVYTGNSIRNIAPTTSIEFAYITRQDITPLYQAGSLIRNTALMSAIWEYVQILYYGTFPARSYGLGTDWGKPPKRWKISSVGECGEGWFPDCRQPTTFTWQGSGNNLVAPSYANPALPATIAGGYVTYNSKPQYMIVGDFNGDGKPDYMWVPDNGDGRWLIAYSTGNGFTMPDYNAPALPATITGGYVTYPSQPQYMMTGDFNGDGKTDYMWIPNNGDGRWLIAYSTGNGFTMPDYNAPALPASIGGGYLSYHSQPPQYMMTGDFNGDGKTDYMWVPNNGDGRWLIAYSTGNGFTMPDYNAPALPATITGGYVTYHSQPQYMKVGDFNGDGKMDYMWIPNNQQFWDIAYSTGSGFNIVQNVIPASVGGYNSYHSQPQYMKFGDFNGDGMMDYMWIPYNQQFWDMAYSTGNGFNIVQNVIPASVGGYNSYHIQPQYMMTGDFNGDGMTDYMWAPNNGDGRWLIAYSTGNGFTTPNYNSPALPATITGGYLSHHYQVPYNIAGDFNGDGKTDFMWVPNNGDGRWLIATANIPGSQADLLTTITDGLGAVTSVVYKPLTDGSVYTKGSGAVYPQLDFQGPLYVVSSVSASDGVGGSYTVNYSYGGAKVDLSGRGFLGFGTRGTQDPQSGINATTSYLQNFPCTGLVSSSQKTYGSVVLNKVDNSYMFGATGALLNSTSGNACVARAIPSATPCKGALLSSTSGNACGTQSVVLVHSAESSYELNGGALVTTVTTDNAYDGYGNPTSIAVSTGDGYSKTTTNIYRNDTANWFLGRLTRSTVTSTTP